ncbi:MAG: extracellular solute-binding protein [Clostridia bacterium]|nr:extracellular solute-binding protein [Clostridia bacterium]
MKKRIVSLLACGILAAGAVAGLTACGDDGITVWGSAAQQDTLNEMVKAFKEANPDVKCSIKVGVGEEDMAYSNVSKDPSAAADVYAYSNDQLVNLLRVGALAELGGLFLDEVKANNSAESVASVTIGETVYGYPFASDNGYFMFYDKSVVSEEDAGSLETIISRCETAGKKIGWAVDVPWYTAGFFFTFGCRYNVEYDYAANYTEKNIEIDFNTENGIKASKAIAKLTGSSAFAGKNTDNGTIIDGFSTHSMAVAVSGTWNAKRIQSELGTNYGVCKLPTVDVDGTPTQMSSFKGYKLFGVNPHSKYLVEAHKLAAFLSSGAMQQQRFEKHLIGPTNTEVANQTAIKNDPTFAALNAQNAFAVEQTSVPSNFWEPLKSYGLNIIDKLIDETGTKGANFTYQKFLDNMVASITNK